MIPTAADLNEFLELVRPYAVKDRVTIHFGSHSADPVRGSRQSADEFVVWVGNKYDKSEKSLCHAARKAIKQYDASYGGPQC